MKKYERKKSIHKHCMANYNEADINDKLIINLRDLSHTMRFLYEGKGSQKRILIILNEIGNITQRALTERLDIQPGSASEVIAKLENAGLVTRTPNETDHRTVDIALTEKGKQLALKATEQRKHRHEEMFSCLSADEKMELLLLLEKINADWELHYQYRKSKGENSKHYHGNHNHHNNIRNLERRE